MRDLLLRIGNYSQIISVNGNTTIFVGNTRGKEPYQKTHSNLAEALFSFMDFSISILGPVIEVGVPVPQLTTILLDPKTSNVSFEFFIRSDPISVASHPDRDQVWSQYGIPFIGYLEPTDLRAVIESQPFYGHGIEAHIGPYTPVEKPSIIVKYPSKVPINEEVQNITFPNGWKENKLENESVTIETAEVLYVISKNILPKLECKSLQSKLLQAIDFQTRGENHGKAMYLDEVVQADLHKYAAQYKY